MNQQNFRAVIRTEHGDVLRCSLEVLDFKEGGVYIMYCPSLDISAAGHTLPEAKSEFAQMFSEYASDCMVSGTLYSDLLAHGWQRENEVYHAPSMTQMLIGNEMLREIVDQKSYRKQVVPFILPIIKDNVYAR